MTRGEKRTNSAIPATATSYSPGSPFVGPEEHTRTMALPERSCMSVGWYAFVDDHTVTHVNHATFGNTRGGFGIVRDHQRSSGPALYSTGSTWITQFPEFCVSMIPGWFVRQLRDNFWFVNDRARDGHALLLSTGHFRWPVLSGDPSVRSSLVMTSKPVRDRSHRRKYVAQWRYCRVCRASGAKD